MHTAPVLCARSADDFSRRNAIRHKGTQSNAVLEDALQITMHPQ